MGGGHGDGISHVNWLRRLPDEEPAAWLVTGKACDPVAFGDTHAFCLPAGGYIAREADSVFRFPIAAVDLSSGLDTELLLNVPFKGKMPIPTTNYSSTTLPDGTHSYRTLWHQESAITELHASGGQLEIVLGQEKWSASVKFDISKVSWPAGGTSVLKSTSHAPDLQKRGRQLYPQGDATSTRLPNTGRACHTPQPHATLRPRRVVENRIPGGFPVLCLPRWRSRGLSSANLNKTASVGRVLQDEHFLRLRSPPPGKTFWRHSECSKGALFTQPRASPSLYCISHETRQAFCPVGAIDNSPATLSLGERSKKTLLVPEGRWNVCSPRLFSAVPTGLSSVPIILPAVNCWATVGRPYGTKFSQRTCAVR